MDELKWLEKRLSSLSVDDYEIYALEARQFSVEAKEGQIDAVDEAVERGVALRLFRGNKTSFGSSSDFAPDFLERMVALAYNSFSVIEDGPAFFLPSDRDGVRRVVETRGSLERGDKTPKLQMALDLERFAKDYDERVKRVRDACYAEEVRTVTLKNSRGLERRHSSERHEISLMVMAEDSHGQEVAWESDYAPHPDRLDPKKTAREAAEKAISQLGGKPAATQRTSAVLDATVATSFLGVLSSSFLGDQVLKNRSALRGKLREEIYAPCISIVDDGRLEGGYNSFPFDGEGVETGRRFLVERGVLREFLYDLTSASQAGTASTGNAVRQGLKEPPRVGATNFFIEPGEASLEKLLSEMGRGLWIRDVIGVHTADAVTGDFSLGATGVWIEGGKRDFPVRGITISGNLHDLMKRVVCVGKDIRRYHAFGCPPLLIDGIDMGGE